MSKIDPYIEEYGSSHQNATNKLIHWICVPAIVFSLLGLIWSIPSGMIKELAPDQYRDYINFGSIFVLLAIIYYIRLSFSLALGMVFISYSMLWACYKIDNNWDTPLWMVSLIVFVVAWIGQFYGHKIEGKKPSFLKDVQFLLIGPVWLLHFIYKKIGIPY